jgi:hypothetical protein
MTKVLQRPLDACLPPTRIVDGHLNHQAAGKFAGLFGPGNGGQQFVSLLSVMTICLVRSHELALRLETKEHGCGQWEVLHSKSGACLDDANLSPRRGDCRAELHVERPSRTAALGPRSLGFPSCQR